MREKKVHILQKLSDRKIITVAPYVAGGCQYLTIMGSYAYGVAETDSDCDLYGFTIPPKDMVFPHLAGHIPEFGVKPQRFEQFDQHHIVDPDDNKEYDFAVYDIVKYFQLTMECNPNMIDSLFTPHQCVRHSTKIGNMVRDARRDFLTKRCWHSFKGYAYSQLHKARIKNPEGKRKATVEKFGWDVKFGYHVVRLINEVEQILTEHDIDLQRNREQLKAIRKGEMGLREVEAWFTEKEKSLEALYQSSTLRHKPDEPRIKKLLVECLEEYYGSIQDCVALDGQSIATSTLSEIAASLEKYQKLMGKTNA